MSVNLRDLTAGQNRNLLDVAQLVSIHTTIDGLACALAVRLQHALNFDLVTLGLYDSNHESVRLNVWNAGGAKSTFESLAGCASRWSWKNQRSVLIHDLDAEFPLPIFLGSLRKAGVRTYYVLPLTTIRQRIGAIGFGSLHVIPKTNQTIEFLHHVAAMIAQVLDTTLSSGGHWAPPDCGHRPLAVTPAPEPELMDLELRDPPTRDEAFQEIVGDSASLREVQRQVRTVAVTSATVLLEGETGTGKELVARALHRLSPRASNNFISVNCTAIPTELLESELFGHEKGAFTGATHRYVGRLEAADKGTLLLDEVGDLPLTIQPKLLRVLQNKEFERLGSTRTLKVDVRLIAATNHDLRQSIAEGRFREDLFYRLNVFPLEMPPLRDRKQDIPVLVEYFIHRYAAKAHKAFRRVSKKTLSRLQAYPWPGNVRELQNVIERSVIVSDTEEFVVDGSWLTPVHKLDGAGALTSRLSAYEKALIEEALLASGGQVFGPTGAAARLRLPRTTLESRIRALRINKSRFRPPPD